jgi:parallel beta-helix repeat protein
LPLVVALVSLFALGKSWAAATVALDCDVGGVVTEAVARLAAGDTLVVSGTCRESVFIGPEVHRITIDGQGKATVLGPDPERAPFTLLGQEIVIRGFTVRGGRNGINVLRGATAVIDGNIIEQTGSGGQPGSGDGINVGQHGYARIVNNTIRSNPQSGIVVHEGAAARIGLLDVANATTGPNLIADNGGHGVVIARSSSARLAGNTIRGNGGDGIHVRGVSHASVSGNHLDGNAGSAIAVLQNSGLDLGTETGRLGQAGGGLLGDPNTTDPAHTNREFGLRCADGAYVEGRLGTLAGVQGAKALDDTCVHRLQP